VRNRLTFFSVLPRGFRRNAGCNNGDMTADNSHAYGWDTENKLTGIDSRTSNGICQTYDALGRVVEQDKGLLSLNLSRTNAKLMCFSISRSR